MRKNDHLDDDLFEDFAEGELEMLALEAKEDTQRKNQHIVQQQKSKRPIRKWAFWLIAASLILQVVAFLPKTFSIPAIDFLKTSAKLSSQHNIQTYKKAIVAIETADKKGTGFSIDKSGTILTNFHVVEGNKSVTVAFKDEGLYRASVVETYPQVDLAILHIDSSSSNNFSQLELENRNDKVKKGLPVYLIGNPLGFIRIANKGEVIGKTRLSGWSEDVYMISAPVYQGNSGSPVVDHKGKVIGIVFAALDHEDHGKVGLAIPVSVYDKFHSKSSSTFK